MRKYGILRVSGRGEGEEKSRWWERGREGEVVGRSSRGNGDSKRARGNSKRGRDIGEVSGKEKEDIAKEGGDSKRGPFLGRDLVLSCPDPVLSCFSVCNSVRFNGLWSVNGPLLILRHKNGLFLVKKVRFSPFFVLFCFLK